MSSGRTNTRTFRRRARLALSLFCVASLARCTGERAGADANADRPVQGGTLVVAGPNDLQGMNGLTATEAYTHDILLNVLFLPLVRLSATGDYEPALARSWDWEGDTVVTFHLRDDVRWHDGQKTLAHDVAFTFERARDSATAFPNLEDLEPWRGVTVLDSLTVRFSLVPHIDPLLAWAFLPIMPKHALDSIAPERLTQAAFNHQPVGNGPFRFVEYRAGDRWVFEANPDHPAGLGGRPHVDRFVWRIIPDNAAQLTELLTGNVDLILAPRAEELTKLESQPGVKPLVRTSRMYHFIGWNGKDTPLGDARVRRALTLAIDRNEILQVLRGGRGQLAAGPIAPFHWAYTDSVQPLPFDTTAAKALLAEAGLRDTNGDGRLELPDGRPFNIEMKVAASNAFNRDVAQMIQSDLAAVGVTLTLRPTEFSTLIDDISSPARRFQAVLMGWNADFRINLNDTFHSAALGGPYQLASYRNVALDALLDTLDGITDRAQAVPRWHRVQRILRDDQPWTFLYYVPSLYAMRERVRGVEMDARGTFITLPAWWLADATALSATN
jgi:peptide/nickel transport system substrate-binding protein